MSQTSTVGLADPIRWNGIAAGMVDYLDQWLTTAPAERTLPPRGTIAGAKRFLKFVLDGIALSRREQPQRQVPAMAGLSNLTIAVEVLTALPPAPPPDLKSVEESICSYLQSLASLQDEKSSATVPEADVRTLRAFFEELQHQGELARHVELVQGQGDLPLR